MAAESHDFAGLPVISISDEALAEILLAGRETNGVFSCNVRGEVWPARKYGRVRPEERTYLDFPALEEIVSLILGAWPSGGRFRVTSRGVALVANDEPLFAFDRVFPP